MSFLIQIVFISISFCNGLEFPKKKIVFNNGVSLQVEVAQTPQQRSHGLMYREKLGEGEGMLFVFPKAQTMSFWMKNTYVSLSIGFFDEKRKLYETQDMEAMSGPMLETQLKQYISSRPGLYALEVQKGWFVKNKIKVGMSFSFAKK